MARDWLTSFSVYCCQITKQFKQHHNSICCLDTTKTISKLQLFTDLFRSDIIVVLISEGLFIYLYLPIFFSVIYSLQTWSNLKFITYRDSASINNT